MHSNELNGHKKPKTLSDWQEELWETNVGKDWHTLKRTPLEMHALITTEIAEATEAVRDGIPAIHIGDNDKPEGEAIELADAVIRIMNYFTEMNWDLDFCLELKNNYNKTREDYTERGCDMRRKPEPPIIGIDEDDNLWINGKIANEGDSVLFTLDGITEEVEINDILIWKATGYDWSSVIKIEVHLSNGYILESIEEIKEMLS